MLKPKVGQWCRVRYSDVGARDGICVERDQRGFGFLEPFESTYPQSIEYNQVIALGKMVIAEGNGL